MGKGSVYFYLFTSKITSKKRVIFSLYVRENNEEEKIEMRNLSFSMALSKKHCLLVALIFKSITCNPRHHRKYQNV